VKRGVGQTQIFSFTISTFALLLRTRSDGRRFENLIVSVFVKSGVLNLDCESGFGTPLFSFCMPKKTGVQIPSS
jgi:hypothetical protein